MDRRDFAQHLAAAGLGLIGAGAARAQGGAPEEGKHFVKLQTAAPTTLPSGKKIELIEFFWYGCPHCFSFEPVIHPWSKKLPADVYFHQMPFAHIGPVEHQKLFYALEELGQREALQGRLFNAIHVENKRINSESDIASFVAANGVDAAKFGEAWRSFAVATKVSRGKTLSNAYKVDSVPTIGIQGRYFTSASLAGSPERALAVTEFLMNRVRQGG